MRQKIELHDIIIETETGFILRGEYIRCIGASLLGAWVRKSYTSMQYQNYSIPNMSYTMCLIGGKISRTVNRRTP